MYGYSGISRRSLLQAAAAMGVGARMAPTASKPPEPNERIRVGKDRWSFVGARTGRPFVPFGSNLVLTDKADLDIFGPRFAARRYETILDACASLSLNILKVFLPVGAVLPDPQLHDRASIAPGYLDNLTAFLGMCRRRGIRAVVTLAEWRGFECRWWQEGGQYWGRRPWRTDSGPGSIAVLCDFWKQLGAALRHEPAVFAYTPVVELTTPSGNLTPPWAPPPERIGIMPGEIALWYWRRWLRAKYRTLDQLNRAWGTSHAGFDDVPEVTYAHDLPANRYTEPEAMIFDYQNFREWTTLRYLVPQIAAIRKADPGRMVTISNHERSWNLWTGAARHFLGYTPAEQARYLDYMTYHCNRDVKDLQREPMEFHLREMEVMLRFSVAGRPMPIVMEEFTFGSLAPNQTAEMQALMVRRSIGHASGWLTWYLQYPKDVNVADSANPSAWLTESLEPTPWGTTARSLAGELRRADLGRKPARRVVRLDRRTELVPKQSGVLIDTMFRYDQLDQPTDYRVSYEPDLNIRL